MRALEMLHNRLEERMQFMHASRWQAVWRVVLALLASRRLWLTALGRALPCEARRKHAIKAVDRLLGNARLHAERVAIGAELVALAVHQNPHPIVLVDTVEIRHRVVGFTASLAHQGRSLPIYSMVIEKLRANARECRRFLRELAQVLPPNSSPVLLTDGGFETVWFREVQKLGWHYIGRVRGQTKFLYDGEWVGCAKLHSHATRRARNLGVLTFPKTRGDQRRVVLSKLPSSGHRQVKTRSGPSRDSNYHHYRKNACEPLILTTSLLSAPESVVELYRLRMQIEETFRDLKSHRWGWSLRHCGSRSHKRIEVLLLIAAVAAFVQQLTGLAGELQGLHHRHQANTVRSERVLSLFMLGGLLLNGPDGHLLTIAALRRAIAKLRKDLRCLHSTVS